MTEAEYIQGSAVEKSVLCPEASCFRKGVKSHVFRVGYDENQHYDAPVKVYSNKASQVVVESSERACARGYGVGINVGDRAGSIVKYSGAECGLVCDINVEGRVDLKYQQEQVFCRDRVDQLGIWQRRVVNQVIGLFSEESPHSRPRRPISGCLPDSDDNSNHLVKCVDSDFALANYHTIASIN